MLLKFAVLVGFVGLILVAVAEPAPAAIQRNLPLPTVPTVRYIPIRVQTVSRAVSPRVTPKPKPARKAAHKGSQAPAKPRFELADRGCYLHELLQGGSPTHRFVAVCGP